MAVSTGDFITAAQWNNLNNAIGVQVTKNATQAVAGSTPTIVTFPTEDWDSSAFHDLVTNNSRLTIPAGMDGKYLITGKVAFVGGTVPGPSNLAVYLNGAMFARLSLATLADSGSIQGSITLVLAAGNYIELVAQVVTASTLQSVVSDYSPCYFSAVFLGT